MSLYWKELRKGASEGFRRGWMPPKVFIRMYFAPVSRGLWRYALATGRQQGWWAGVKAYFNGTESMARGKISFW